MGNARPYGGPAMLLDILQREVDVAYEEGGLFQVTFHPHHLGHRSRIFILEELIRQAQSKPGVWLTTHADLARFCAAEAGLEACRPRRDRRRSSRPFKGKKKEKGTC